MLKKLLCCSLSLITLMGFGFGTCQKVNASESIVQPRAVMCGCGGYFRPSGTYYTNWSYDNVTRKCTHYARGLDERQSRKKFKSICVKDVNQDMTKLQLNIVGFAKDTTVRNHKRHLEKIQDAFSITIFYNNLKHI